MKKIILIILLSVGVSQAGLWDLFGLLSWNDTEINEYINSYQISINNVVFKKGLIIQGQRIITKEMLDRIVEKNKWNWKADVVMATFDLKVDKTIKAKEK